MPTELVLDLRRNVVGFLMETFEGKPIHQLYSPQDRKRAFPDLTYQFLVFVARNLAAAVDALHQHGVVIGDVNQRNILFDPQKGFVRFLDCDSFQVKQDNTTFRCSVGVVDYTPPELQRQNFSKVDRTQNHDHFGVAVLIFHLLFLGRHPYSGVYKLNREPPSLAESISEHLFAYALRDATRECRLHRNSQHWECRRRELQRRSIVHSREMPPMVCSLDQRPQNG